MIKNLTVVSILAVSLTGCAGDADSENNRKFAAALETAQQHIQDANRRYATVDFLNRAGSSATRDMYRLEQLKKAQEELNQAIHIGSPDQQVATRIISAEVYALESGMIAAQARSDFYSNPIISVVRPIDPENPDGGTENAEISATDTATLLAKMMATIQATLQLSNSYSGIDYQSVATEIEAKLGQAQANLDDATNQLNAQIAQRDQYQARHDELKQEYQQLMTKSAELEEKAFNATNPQDRFNASEQAAKLRGEAQRISADIELLVNQIETANADLAIAEKKVEIANNVLNALRQSNTTLSTNRSNSNLFAQQTKGKADELFTQFEAAYNEFMTARRDVVGDNGKISEAIDLMDNAIGAVRDPIPNTSAAANQMRQYHLAFKRLEQGLLYLQWLQMEEVMINQLDSLLTAGEGLDQDQLRVIQADLEATKAASGEHRESTASMLNEAISDLNQVIADSRDSDLTALANRSKLTAARGLLAAGQQALRDAGQTPLEPMIRQLEAELPDTATPATPDPMPTEEDEETGNEA